MENATMEQGSRNVGRTLRVLFIGNSATYMHDLPLTLGRLATDAGYPMECHMLVKGGWRLSQHADAESEWGAQVFAEIAQGYDLVFLQDNGNCITSDELREASMAACRHLAAAVTASGGQIWFYVRPPYGTEHAGRSPFAQCEEFDRFFGEIGAEIGAKYAHVNRAFAYAMMHLPYDLWGPDHAHTSEWGAYLAICVFFAAIFGKSSALLGANDLPPEDARALQAVADAIVLEGSLPW